MTEIEKNGKHRRRMEVFELCARVFGQVCALSTVIMLVMLAWHFADRGFAAEGAAIIISGAFSIVTVFVTGRITQPKQPPTAPEDQPSPVIDVA